MLHTAYWDIPDDDDKCRPYQISIDAELVAPIDNVQENEKIPHDFPHNIVELWYIYKIYEFFKKSIRLNEKILDGKKNVLNFYIYMSQIS